MATRDAEALDRTLAALADPTRRAMVERLAKNGRMAISDLATPFPMSLPAVLKHVGVLTEAGLVSRIKVGRTVYCHLLSAPIRASLVWLRKYEDYQLPADVTSKTSQKAAKKAARKTPEKAAAPASKKRAAAKSEPKPAPRAARRAQPASKAKVVPARRAKAASPAPAASQRGGRPTPRPQPRRSTKAAVTPASRRRPRR